MFMNFIAFNTLDKINDDIIFVMAFATIGCTLPLYFKKINSFCSANMH